MQNYPYFASSLRDLDALEKELASSFRASWASGEYEEKICTQAFELLSPKDFELLCLIYSRECFEELSRGAGAALTEPGVDGSGLNARSAASSDALGGDNSGSATNDGSDHAQTPNSKTRLPKAIVRSVQNLSYIKNFDKTAYKSTLEARNALEEAFYKKVFASASQFLKQYFFFEYAWKTFFVQNIDENFYEFYAKENILLPQNSAVQNLFEAQDFQIQDLEKKFKEISSLELLERERQKSLVFLSYAKNLSEASNMSLDYILAYFIRFRILRRWNALQEENGREKLQEKLNEFRALCQI